MYLNSLIESDRRHLIHPVSAYRAHEARGATVLASAQGMYVTDQSGHELLDAFAGLWCVNVGYGQESIVSAAAEQMRRLPYATGYFSFASEPTIRLAERLADLSPEGLTRVYFTLGGSDAVDSAIRFIVHYFNATGRPAKKQMIALDKGYHGSSSTGAGLTGLPAFHRQFDLPRAWQHHIPAPYAYRSEVGADDAALIAQSVAQLRAKVEELGAENVAAFFAEPVQGSAGVLVPPRGWLKAMRDTCRELDILFVADEVITGFGRTGPLFACESEGVSPDLMTMAKGLTAGYAPMGAVLMSEAIYAGIADGPDNHLPIGHGFTYSGHPVSAAVGLEVLSLYLEGGILANGQERGGQLQAGLAGLLDHPLVGNVRSAGMLAGIELVCDKAAKTRFAGEIDISGKLSAAAYARGLIFRAFADGTIGLAPALSCSEADMGHLLERLRATLDDVLEDKAVRSALV
ncbi:aminotransferase class III-fold pyridoxal phosphate-dependent enzyme [Novosphingobium sp. 1949]|uniref:Aminotransferase class III-fold pyridoxal phosphate-dependent enzyme n=1 Tax=Novosphingobium organovorum TaxID=2930092 RepID=A0ABT0BD07_9SPHN|nr:aminotransferase class III-fold pyridoxal phosphate-dependent enzyme [Novosphingobium organovorum]MCJ2182950.1 aminotransferase class III-fold pyridoxal phosphate-dependent enzyme [Novosphingobium organovorum]